MRPTAIVTSFPLRGPVDAPCLARKFFAIPAIEASCDARNRTPKRRTGAAASSDTFGHKICEYPRKNVNQRNRRVMLLHAYFARFTAVLTQSQTGCILDENFSSTTLRVSATLSRRPFSWSPAPAGIIPFLSAEVWQSPDEGGRVAQRRRS